MISVFSALVVLAVCSTVTSSRTNDLELAIYDETESCWKDFSKDPQIKLKELNCIEACYMNKLGVMSGSNQLVPGKLSDKLFDAESKSQDGITFKQISKFIEEKCKSVTDEDKCVAAVKIYDCVHEQNDKFGFFENALW